jgi:hypothetical protein
MNDLASVRIGDYYTPQPKQQEFHESARVIHSPNVAVASASWAPEPGGNVFSVAGQGNAYGHEGGETSEEFATDGGLIFLEMKDALEQPGLSVRNELIDVMQEARR